MEHIKFITGVMGAGKSRQLIEDYHELQADNRKPIILTLSFTDYNFDTIYVESRNKQRAEALSISIKNQNNIDAGKLEDIITNHGIILIDESQFLSIELLEELIGVTERAGIEIFFYGLTHTFTGEYFESSKYLYENLDYFSIYWIESLCELTNCFNDAAWNGRYIDDVLVKTGETLLESKSTYKALCSKHFKN